MPDNPTTSPPSLLLIVEDEPLIALTVQDALEAAGFTVQCSTNGADAEAVFDDTPVAALITDIRIGSGKDGWELAVMAREIDSTIPIIYMSGDSALDHPSKGVPNSVMIQKPFVPAQIVTAVSTLLNERPAQVAPPADSVVATAPGKPAG